MVHAPEQRSVPSNRPKSAQPLPARSVPSQASLPLTAPSPHSVQPEVSKVQLVLQPKTPPSKPCEVQLSPPTLPKSQSSPASITPSPQKLPLPTQPDVSKAQLGAQSSVPESKPSVTQV